MFGYIGIAVISTLTTTSVLTGGGLSRRGSEMAHRDKLGTNGSPEKHASSQALFDKGLASGFSFPAEGMGFEPTTPFGALDFESSSSPIRIPSPRRGP
jgi:hypothetical protein